ncbi:hypothetical protein QUA54_18710 [Microcoleus sp. MOSTC5]|uniref:hypothetical protein n=1 Tax=Microcoleus sp. MOSTC5 TaxID=3055378 RepID=UPI002FD7322A
MPKTKKLVMTHIHSRIAKLAKAAIDRGEIVSCDQISSRSYLIKRSINGKRPQTTQFTVVGAASLLYLLNAAANASESLDPTEPDSDFSSNYLEPQPKPERGFDSPSEPDFFLNPEPESESESHSDFNVDSEYLEPELDLETETETEFLEAI